MYTFNLGGTLKCHMSVTRFYLDALPWHWFICLYLHECPLISGRTMFVYIFFSLFAVSGGW